MNILIWKLMKLKFRVSYPSSIMNLIRTEKKVILTQHENTARMECSGCPKAYA